MEIEAYCSVCLKWFDAHWHHIPAKDHFRFMKQPWCLDCGSHRVHIVTDEMSNKEREEPCEIN